MDSPDLLVRLAHDAILPAVNEHAGRDMNTRGAPPRNRFEAYAASASCINYLLAHPDDLADLLTTARKR